MKPCSVGSMLKDQSNGCLCVKKMKPCSVGSMLKDQSNGCLCTKKMKPCLVGSILKDQSNGCLCKKRMKPCAVGSMLKDQLSKKLYTLYEREAEYQFKKNQKKIKKKEKKKQKEFVSVVLDKICVFCLYPIPNSQQRVKRGSCKRPHFVRAICFRFNVCWTLSLFMSRFEFGP